MKLKITIKTHGGDVDIGSAKSSINTAITLHKTDLNLLPASEVKEQSAIIDIGKVLLAGTNDYEMLNNLPLLNGTPLIGSVKPSDVKLQPEGDYPEDEITNSEIYDILNK